MATHGHNQFPAEILVHSHKGLIMFSHYLLHLLLWKELRKWDDVTCTICGKNRNSSYSVFFFFLVVVVNQRKLELQNCMRLKQIKRRMIFMDTISRFYIFRNNESNKSHLVYWIVAIVFLCECSLPSHV